MCCPDSYSQAVFGGVIQEVLVYDHLILKANTCSWRQRKVGAALLCPHRRAAVVQQTLDREQLLQEGPTGIAFRSPALADATRGSKASND